MNQGINTVIRRNSQGRIYGITFIDHKSKTVWNGSRFGKEFSANIFNEWWNNNQKPEIKNVQDEKPHPLFNCPGKDEPDLVEGLGGLLPVNNGDDFEELLFENQLKKKKRRQKRRN